MSSVITSHVDPRDANTSQALPQRHASDPRIDGADDDVTAQHFTARIDGTDQAARNANDGISLAQTADGALATTTDHLKRIRQLAVQAADAIDRTALQTEVGRLLSEIDRVGHGATFNGIRLFDGSNPSFVFQVGGDASSGDTISVSGLPTATKAGLGSVSVASPRATARSRITPGALDDATDVLTVDGTSIGALAAVGTSQQRAAQVVDAINRIATTTGVDAWIDPVAGTINLTSASTINIARTGRTTNLTGFTTASTPAATTTGLTTLDVSSDPGAHLAIRQIDSALDQIDGARATLGAARSRFTSVVTNPQATHANRSASRDRIRDAGFAAATVDLACAQILLQAATAIRAQANSVPNDVLTLLKG